MILTIFFFPLSSIFLLLTCAVQALRNLKNNDIRTELLLYSVFKFSILTLI